MEQCLRRAAGGSISHAYAHSLLSCTVNIHLTDIFKYTASIDLGSLWFYMGSNEVCRRLVNRIIC